MIGNSMIGNSTIGNTLASKAWPPAATLDDRVADADADTASLSDPCRSTRRLNWARLMALSYPSISRRQRRTRDPQEAEDWILEASRQGGNGGGFKVERLRDYEPSVSCRLRVDALPSRCRRHHRRRRCRRRRYRRSPPTGNRLLAAGQRRIHWRCRRDG